ncbi:MAG: CRISPR-associated endonuclease Cas1 [Syntrophorhabdus aromaticivorans]|uniref:CRISPR-associated endonuclease Cas1 n=1 Tax=Syntrophorhabdus aromaticivorans TaxID=328301 RepID=A0A971M591_9BACT|nr:CRISPR-associated endonuclease Cas1 [Syntrophorhabdus aromaticivorans]
MAELYETLCRSENLFRAWESVRAKGSAGGIDGVSIDSFESGLDRNLEDLADELRSKRFIPQPYKQISIPKDENEFRNLSLPTIKDKIVQQAIRDIIEPVLDKEFLDVSYGYRRNKGPVKAIARTTYLLTNEKRSWVTLCDIDGYFDNVHHDTLFAMLSERLRDEDLLTLIRLYVKMGRVDARGRWIDSIKGIPQGGVVSPLLSNLYLHPLDRMMTDKGYGYIRYADDFIVLSRSEAEAYSALRDIAWFIEKRMRLRLNPEKQVKSVGGGFEFLGITFRGTEKHLSNDKMVDLKRRIESAIVRETFPSITCLPETLQGIEHYYGRILPQHYLEELDEWAVSCVKKAASGAYRSGVWASRKDMERVLGAIDFISEQFRISKNKAIKDICAYCTRRSRPVGLDRTHAPAGRTDPVRKRKREYQKLEAEGFELVIATPGVFVGKTKKGISVKKQGTKLYEAHHGNLKHIFITTKGVTLSSHVIAYCAEQEIPIDFLNYNGMPYARLYPLHGQSTELQLAQLKALAGAQGRHLAKEFVGGKIRNQLNLAKYYHKYRKTVDPEFVAVFNEKTGVMEAILDEIKKLTGQDMEDLRGKLFSIEGRAAASYWEMVKVLLDDVIAFDGRERQGATDLVNSLLNYGYGVLYSKIWYAVMSAGLSPFLSFLHEGSG